jgi:hypothetical protein
VSKSLIKIVLMCFTLCWYPAQASAANVFSFAEINVPFDVRVNGSWVEVIESRDAWESFYVENAVKYLGPNSESIIVPEFDFESYTVVAGGLSAGGSDRLLMLAGVRASGSITYIDAVAIRAEGACNGIAIETYPTIVILIPKPEGTLRVNTRQAFYCCN